MVLRVLIEISDIKKLPPFLPGGSLRFQYHGKQTQAVRFHAQQGCFPACKEAAVWFTDRGYKLLLLPAGSMTTTSFFCRKKALWPFPPITLPRPEPFVNPAPQILQLLCRAARLCATVPTSAVVFRQIPPLFRRPRPSMIMVQRGSGQRRPGSQSRRRTSRKQKTYPNPLS